MKNVLFLAITTLLCGLFPSQSLQAQNFVIKTNALHWAALAPNLGVEWAMNRHMSWELTATYKPWMIYPRRSGVRFWLLQPAWRYWLREPYAGHFVGLHLHGAQYYARHRGLIYDGTLFGGGFTYGYNWPLTSHWHLESLIGVGYARLWYKRHPDLPCEKCASTHGRNYIGPTQLAVSICYRF